VQAGAHPTSRSSVILSTRAGIDARERRFYLLGPLAAESTSFDCFAVDSVLGVWGEKCNPRAALWSDVENN
jgi:hypothetical protein